ncbi:hypothetical protein [Miltoncostaea marina]|uniref:hypothetical protein n=1 Tax=Miltoncostaea marina TaxID=2843215 RepID=UPI001C3D1D39|nr:hypothetical protein [Miltoncostaea marina]
MRAAPACALVLVLVLVLAGAPAAAAADPAEAALAARDAYVSPRVLGSAAAPAERELAEVAAAMADAGRPVKLAVVLGPTGAPSLPAYARRLVRTLEYEGTLLVTRARGPVVAVGSRPTADMTVQMRAARIGAHANQVERLTAAAALVVPPPPDERGELLRPALGLLAVAALGGGWAAAVGAGRAARGRRRRAAEARARARVRLDALRAHAGALLRRPGLPPGERAHVEAALGAYADAVSALRETDDAERIAALDPPVAAALVGLEGVAERVGAPHPRGDIFAGLCAVDPSHGPAGATAPVGDRPDAPVCGGCAEAAAGGARLVPRRIPAGAGGLPFTAAAEPV